MGFRRGRWKPDRYRDSRRRGKSRSNRRRRRMGIGRRRWSCLFLCGGVRGGESSGGE